MASTDIVNTKKGVRMLGVMTVGDMQLSTKLPQAEVDWALSMLAAKLSTHPPTPLEDNKVWEYVVPVTNDVKIVFEVILHDGAALILHANRAEE